MGKRPKAKSAIPDGNPTALLLRRPTRSTFQIRCSMRCRHSCQRLTVRARLRVVVEWASSWNELRYISRQGSKMGVRETGFGDSCAVGILFGRGVLLVLFGAV